MGKIRSLEKQVFIGERTLPPLPRHLSRIIQMETPQVLQAGAAKVDVTPSESVTMRGFAPRQSTGVHSHLYVRALVLDNGETRLAILSWDKLVPYDLPQGFEEIAAIRDEINRRIGIPPENILINVIHTHSGCEGPFEEASIEAVSKAWESRREARIGIGSRMIYGIGSNRRLPDGTGLWNCNQPNPESVMDNECGIIRVEDYDRKIIAVVANYSAHPTVLDGDNTLLSGDYAGLGMAEVEKNLGDDCVALFLQGCAGDTGTHTFRRKRSIPEAERLGRKLSGEVLSILKHIDVVSRPRLSGKKRFIKLPQKTQQQMERPTIPPISGKSIKDEIQVLIIDDCAIVSVGSMEAYVDIGLKIKEASRFKHTFTVAYSNGPWLGYLPSVHGYEVNDPDAKETPFSSAAPEVLVKECVQSLEHIS